MGVEEKEEGREREREREGEEKEGGGRGWSHREVGRDDREAPLVVEECHVLAVGRHRHGCVDGRGLDHL